MHYISKVFITKDGNVSVSYSNATLNIRYNTGQVEKFLKKRGSPYANFGKLSQNFAKAQKKFIYFSCFQYLHWKY